VSHNARQGVGNRLIDIYRGIAIFQDRPNKLVGEERVRTAVAALHAQRFGQSFKVVRLGVTLDTNFTFRLPVGVRGSFAVFANPHYGVRRFFRSGHEIGQAVAIKMCPFCASGSDMPKHRYACRMTGGSLKECGRVPEGILVFVGP